MSKAEEAALKVYPQKIEGDSRGSYDLNELNRQKFLLGYNQAEKDVAEAFARIIRGNLGGIGNGIQNMFEQLYTDITGEKMYKGFND